MCRSQTLCIFITVHTIESLFIRESAYLYNIQCCTKSPICVGGHAIHIKELLEKNVTVFLKSLRRDNPTKYACDYKTFILKSIFYNLMVSDERVFLLFHKNLSDALTQLAQAIHAVLSRKYF